MPGMTDPDQLNDEYHPPSVKRWGTVLDLTAGGDVGGSSDAFSDDPASVDCPSASDNSNGSGNGCGGS